MTVKAYAKINLILNVLGTRPDGYHEVEMVMQAIDLCDDVDVQCTEGGGFSIELDPGREDLPADRGNLAYRAAELMHSAYHGEKDETIKIKITKRIPVAAGMAGGSTDAAAVIWALAKLWGIEDEEALEALGAKLGADVPFCIMVQSGRTAAIARGTGTELQPIAPTELGLLVSTPPVSVSTKDVYGECREGDCAERMDVTPFEKDLGQDEKLAVMGNHLMPPAIRLFPLIRERIEQMKTLDGALLTMMSGSGPTVFSVFPPGMEPHTGSSDLSGTTIVSKTLMEI